MTPARGPVAIIDIGSNSIKALVADRAPDGTVRSLAAKTVDARISAGISRSEPRLSDEGMARGLLNKQIAWDLGIAEKTVKMHRALLLERLGVATSAEAIRLAVEAGL